MTRRDAVAGTAAAPRSAPAGRQPATIRGIVRGLGALLALLLLVVCIPAVLITVAPLNLPDAVPSPEQVLAALTRPDDGHLFLAALTLTAWAGWGAFTLSTLVETVAQIRGLPTVRLPLLGGPQRGAALLVTAIAMMLTPPAPTGVAAHVRPAVVATADIDHPLSERSTVIGSPASPAPTSAVHGRGGADGIAAPDRRRPSAPNAAARPARGQPTVAVHRGDTLWTLAERHLGNGGRYTEIAALNYGRTQPDGRHLNSAHWIYPGWTLLLPPDARPAPGDGADGSSVVVHRGDTLWDIAESHLGDARRYPEIVDLNAGHPQPDGTTLTDADVIQPGWTLDLPTRTTKPAAGGGAPSGRDTDQGTASPAPAVPDPTPSTSSTGASTTSATPTSSSGVTSSPARTEPAPLASVPVGSGVTSPGMSATTPIHRAPATPSHDQDPHDPSSGVPSGMERLLLGLGAVTAAGLVAEVTRRRRRQQRHRRPGERIDLPDYDVAAMERQLRAAHDPAVTTTIRAVLHELASACTAAGRDLPRLAAVLYTPDAVDILLAEDDDQPPGGFAPIEPNHWRYPTPDRDADPGVAVGTPADDEPAEPFVGMATPYPTLITLGAIDDGLLLANLEAAGTLRLSGAPDRVTAVRRALAVELISSPLTETTWVTLGPDLADLAEVTDVVRARQVAGPEEARAFARSRDHDVRAILDRLGVRDVVQARSRNPDADLDPPTVHVLAEGGFPVDAWSGQALITGTPALPADVGGTGWTLVLAEGGARLEPLGIDIYPQHLAPQTYRRVLDLLAADARPAPEPQRADPGPREQAAAALAALPADTPVERTDRTTPAQAPLPQTSHEAEPESGAPLSDHASAPRVLLLGPVTIDGAHDDAVPNRRRRLTELVAYLALHPGASYHEIDEALWPGQRVVSDTRNALVSRARRWLGHTPTGDPYLPTVAAEGDYRLHPAVGCDWHDFTVRARRGLEAGEDGTSALAAALGLVRGRPFLGVDPRDYAWAEADTQQMITSIVDVAHVLASIRLQTGDHRRAQNAAVRGLLAEPCSELLYRDALRAASLRGDHDEVARLADRLQAQIERIDPDGGPEDETIELLSVLRHRT